jgi:glycosyltransferase involved in cell wall biosynthesis
MKPNQMFDDAKLGPYSLKLKHYFPNPIFKSIKSIRILRVICQRPYFTGSGVNLINLTKQTQTEGIDQFIIYGQPVGEENPFKGIIHSDKTSPITFKSEQSPLTPDIPFPVVGMSDQMPYQSTKFSEFNEFMLEQYLKTFAEKIQSAVDLFKPTIIHSHHLWLVSALCRVLNPQIPTISTCHNTGLRQMLLAPQLKEFIYKPISDIDFIAVNNEDQRDRVKKLYNFPGNKNSNKKFFFIGQGINTNVFYPPNDREITKSKTTINLIYVGKLSNSKGVPYLLEAYKEICSETDHNIHLYLVGSGEGPEKENILKIGETLAEKVSFLGQLNQDELSERFRACDLFILPSFYDAFPKVLLESLACGCKAIITDLSGIKDDLEDSIGFENKIKFLPLPRMKTVDEPMKEDLPGFISNLKNKIKEFLEDVSFLVRDNEYAERVRYFYSWQGLFQKYLEKYSYFLH